MGQSRSEKILENMLGATNILEPAQSREEKLLMQLLEKLNVKVIIWRGVTTTELTDGSTTNPVTIDGSPYTASIGDMVGYGTIEYVFNGTAWQQFGDVNTNTWRILKVNGVQVLDGTVSSGPVDFVGSDNIDVMFDSVGNKIQIKTKNVYTSAKVDEELAKKADIVNYSTSEVKTGQKWIDGKDIYMITVGLSAYDEQHGKIYLPLTHSEVDKFIKMEGYYIPNDDDPASKFIRFVSNVNWYMSLNGDSYVCYTDDLIWKLTDLAFTFYYTKPTQV